MNTMDERVVIPINKLRKYEHQFMFLLLILLLIMTVSVQIILVRAFVLSQVDGFEFVVFSIISAILIIMAFSFAKQHKRLHSFKKAAGLIIDSTGITVDMGYPVCFAGHIFWEDITEIRERSVRTGGYRGLDWDCLSITVKDSEKYNIKEQVVYYNMKKSQIGINSEFPVTISVSFLKCSHDKLKDIIAEQFVKYKNKKGLRQKNDMIISWLK